MISELTQISGVVAGEIVGVDEGGRPIVRWNALPSVAARAIWTPGAPPWRDCAGVRVLVGFLEGDEAQPIVLGFLEPPPTIVNTPVEQRSAKQPETLRIEAGRELVIECGEAKISLRKDGRIEIRGTHLISRSSGPNKIKGGSVFIN
ncbi:MAG TPA: DUF6484 domain-containing protein [Gemmatimonadaceae bacterium]|nr:DUF6484 domain-containing protein [Gemmatimonadaceae bacterium]